MKQFDYETSNYKHKEDIKTFVQTFNDMADKYVKTYDNREQDLKRANTNIEKKTSAIEKLEVSLADYAKKMDEFKALKEMSSSEISLLNEKKSEISYTDSEVQKMELDDLNSQIAQKRNKISKIDNKMDSTKAKIKAGNEEKKTFEKELKELEKEKGREEEALFRTEGLLSLVAEVKEMVNSRVLAIINEPYRPVAEKQEEPVPEKIEVPLESTVILEEVIPEEENLEEIIEEVEEPTIEVEDEENDDTTILIDDITLEEPVSEIEEVVEQVPEIVEEPKDKGPFDPLLDDMFKKEGIDIASFNSNVREKMLENRDVVMQNLDILKRHSVPLEYTLDQSEIYYNISAQDLDDLLSIITTDDEGNGMGFSIDFTFNILNELSKINVDKLIDVYNSEFMNVNAKSGIIHLLKLTNPDLVDFDKNRRANIEILSSLGVSTMNDIIERYPEFINMDNPLFVNVLNVFDKNDLVEKLNADVDVVPKIIEYWKEN